MKKVLSLLLAAVLLCACSAQEPETTAGPVGIRMAVGETAAGGKGDFAGKRVVVSVGDFHPQEVWAGNTYRIDLINERGVTLSREVKGNEISGDAKVYLALDAEDCMYYRAEVYDVSRDYLVAIGNPIWNGK